MPFAVSKGPLFQKLLIFPFSLIAVIFSWPGFLMLYRYTKEKIMRERRMPVLHGECYVCSHFYFLLASSDYISGGAITWADARRDHLQYARGTLQLPRSAFLAAQAILGCMMRKT